MKKFCACNLIISFILLFSIVNFQLSGQESNQNDNYGKVIGSIIDKNTGKLINERFRLTIFDREKILSKVFPPNAIVDIQYIENGTVNFEIKPGLYCCLFSPTQDSHDSVYIEEQTPVTGSNPIKYFEIAVEKGKITKFIKKINVGGLLRFIFYDLGSNTVINPKTAFNKPFNISCSLEENNGNFFTDEFIASSSDNKNRNKSLIQGIFPGLYEVRIEFKGLGFNFIEEKNVCIESMKETEFKIKIDINDPTGIEGKVINNTNTSAQEINVILIPTGGPAGSRSILEATVDQEGYYILKGVTEGKYQISVRILAESDLLSFYYDYIEIQKGITLKKDIYIAK